MPKTSTTSRPGPLRGQVVLLEDNADHAELCTNLIVEHFPKIQCVPLSTTALALAWLAENRPALIVSTTPPDEQTRESLLRELSAAGHGAPIVMLSSFSDPAVATHMIKLGAADYLLKDQAGLKRLPTLITKYLRKKREKRGPSKQPSHLSLTRLRQSCDRLCTTAEPLLSKRKKGVRQLIDSLQQQIDDAVSELRSTDPK